MKSILETNGNLANPSKFLLHKAYETKSNITTIVDLEACFITDYIPVICGDHIYVTYLPMDIGSPYQGYVARSITLFDSNKNILDFIDNRMYSYTIPEGVSYIRITGYMNAKDYFTVTKNFYTPLYIPYGNHISNIYLPQETNKKASRYNYSNTLAANELIKLNDFPSFIKKNRQVYFSCNLKKLSNTDEILLGFTTAEGPVQEGLQCGYRNFWIGIDQENINFYVVKELDSTVFKFKSIKHNLLIKDFLKVKIIEDYDQNLKISIFSIENYFDTSIKIGTLVSENPLVYFLEMYGVPFFKSSVSISNISFSAACSDLQSPLWLFGDSYFGLSSNRVIGQLKELGYGKNLLIDGFAGGQSPQLYEELLKCLEYNTPKYLVWYLGMNDNWQNYNNTLMKLKKVCGEKNIILILNKIPYVPNDIHSDAAIITNVLRGEAYLRSINSWGAVINPKTIYGDSVNYYGGQWYNGYLEDDNLHPTEQGAKALALQLITDVPEIMVY